MAKQAKAKRTAIPLRYTIDDAAELLSVSRSQMYKWIRQGRISTHRDGSKQFVPHAELERYMAACESQAA